MELLVLLERISHSDAAPLTSNMKIVAELDDFAKGLKEQWKKQQGQIEVPEDMLTF